MHQAGSDSLMTSGVYFKLKKMFKKWYPSESFYIEQNFNYVIYGIGNSVNDDQYIDDYKALATELGNSNNKIINLNNFYGSSGGAATSALANVAMNDFIQHTPSTTMSVNSSVGSLSGNAMHHHNLQMANQQ